MQGTVFERIELYLNCRNLLDLDVFSKSDPYVKVLYKRDYTQHNFYPLGKTQTIKNQLNPNFKTTFTLDFIFESRQDIRFELWDDDGGNDQFIGFAQTTVGNLMGAQSQTSVLELIGVKNISKGCGKLVVRCEKIQEQESNQFFMFRFRAQKLINTDSFFDFWDKSDPYLKLLKIRNDNSFIQVHRTQTIKQNLNPAWQPFEIAASRLINPEKPHFKIQIWDWQEDNPHQFIGEIMVKAQELSKGIRMPLNNPKEKKAGSLLLDDFNRVTRPSFIDYLRGGLQLNMVVAVDFTASNGVPKDPASLHFIHPAKPNQYQTAIHAISQILLSYDSDKRIAALGFGAKPKFANLKSPTVNHCFALSGNPNNMQASGVSELLQFYFAALSNIELSGPTLFGPIISQAIRISQGCKANGSNIYQTLLILTDGAIHDMDATIQLLIQAAYLPISLIIVGVGNADFSNMQRLDGDGGLFGKGGVKCARDIVQFVAFRDLQLNGDILAKELLAELPRQVVQYMSLIGKAPNQFVPIDISKLVPKKQAA